MRQRASLHMLSVCLPLFVTCAVSATTATPTPEPTGSLGTKTTVLHAFNLVTGASLAGAAVECSGPREAHSGVTDVAGTFSCTLELRDSDAILTVIGAPGFAERRRGYSGLDLWTNTLVLQFGLIPEGLCAGDCDGDHAVGINSRGIVNPASPTAPATAAPSPTSTATAASP
jgi:hypothetical protein